jgi:hypothetical protein
MSFGLIKNAAEIADDFDLPEEMRTKAATKAFEQYMESGLYRKAFQIANKYHLPEEMISAAEKKLS